MFSNLKLATFNWFFATLVTTTCIALIAFALYLQSNIALIDNTWEQFQSDRSEKARLESALRSAIGYGGMIHEFKNYVLRQEPDRMKHTHLKIGAARAVLEQYDVLGTNSAEKVALQDIRAMLDHYELAMFNTERMVAELLPTADIDRRVKVDDSVALRGLVTLRSEVRAMTRKGKKASKGRIAADLRAALGYGGLIHHFKNYILRQQPEYAEQAKQKLDEAQAAIATYRQLDPTRAEQVALEDVEAMLSAYGNSLRSAQQLLAEGNPLNEVDKLIKVNDGPALRGLQVLDHEIAVQVIENSNAVTRTLTMVQRIIKMATIGTVVLLVALTLIAIWLMRHYVIDPILRLTAHMTQLADNDLSVSVSGHYQNNEIGHMARAVMIFKDSMIKRQEMEQSLAAAHEETTRRLSDIRELRERAEEQASKALTLAEGLSEARIAAEKATIMAEKEQNRIRSILNAVHDAIITIDTRGIIEDFNPGAEMMFGHKAHQVVGKNISVLMPEPVRNAHDGYLQRYIEGKSDRDMSIPLEQVALRRNGKTFPVEISLNAVMVGTELKITGAVRDITERKKWEEEIKRLALTDPLTGLANRNQYDKRLSEAITLANRFKHIMALLIIDLDKFKPVNDTYGHPVGDALLQHVAHCMVDCCRDVDSIARLGGDEFAIILNGLNDIEEVKIPVQRVVAAIAEPAVIEGHTITIGASIGISCYPTNSTDIEELQRQADNALYQAKEEGRNTYRLFKHNAD